MNLRSQRALSLVEVLVAVGIFSGIIMAVYTVLAVGNKSWITYYTKLSLEREVRWALFAMVKDLREAEGILITKDSESVAIRFKKPYVGIIAFTFNKNGKEANTIIRENNAQKWIIARDISDLSFDYSSTDRLAIALRAEKKISKSETLNFRLQEKITLRK